MPERKPRSKKKSQRTSIWDIVDQEQALERAISRPLFSPLREVGLDSYTHWPQPINFQSHIETLACQTTWQARIKLYGLAFSWWFWSNLVPSPVELTRKFLLGGYKCGFYLPVKFKSPLTLFIGPDGVTFLAEIARPVTTIFFWWWVASSFFTALDTYHTVQMLIAECQNTGAECLKANGHTTFVANGSGQGSGWQLIADTFHKSRGQSGVDVSGTAWTATGFVTIDLAGNAVDACDVWIGTVSTRLHQISLVAQDQSQPVKGMIDHHQSSVGAFIVELWVGIHLAAPWNGKFINADFNRFTVNGIPL